MIKLRIKSVNRFMTPLNSSILEEIIKLHADGKTNTEISQTLTISISSISKCLRNNKLKSNKPPPFKFSSEAKKRMSESRKAWLKTNPDRHPWKKRDKFKSEPCEKVKQFLTELNISFVAEYSPEVSGRFFSIDIALPDKKIALEINGNQHYNRDGSLKPYYQERHDLLVSAGWNVFEIHYSACFNLDKWKDFVNQLINSPVVESFDYFNYKPVIRACKSIKNISNKERLSKIPLSKENLQKLYNELPMVKIAQMFNVSDNAIKKWLKKYNIPLEKRRGFWAKQPKKLNWYPSIGSNDE